MSARTWPSGRPGDEEAATAVPAPAVAVIAIPADPEAAAEKLEGDLRAARTERDEAHAVLTSAREALPGSAHKGLDAVRRAQGAIRESEDRLRLAEEVVMALETAHRPIAEAAYAKRRERRREEMARELGAAVAARDRIDADLLVAIENLSAVAARRAFATSTAYAIEKRAAAEGLAVGSVERYLLPASIREAIKRIPLLGS
jgi:hypothetical protein